MKRSVALAGALLTCVAVWGATRRSHVIEPPVLVVASASSEKELQEKLGLIHLTDAVDEKAEERAVSLALASLSDKNAKELAEALQELLFRTEVRANPLVVDLEGKEPDAELRRVFAAISPTLHAARSIATRMHASKERDVVAVVSDACPVSSAVQCVSLWKEDPSEDKAIARARFLAGPVADAVLLDVKDGAAADELARQMMTASPIHVAIAFTARNLSPRPSARVHEVNSFGKLAATFFKEKGTREQRELLELLAQPPVPSAPWVTLPVNRVVVVPRISSRALLQAFVAEVTNLVGTTPVTWVRRPGQR